MNYLDRHANDPRIVKWLRLQIWRVRVRLWAWQVLRRHKWPPDSAAEQAAKESK